MSLLRAFCVFHCYVLSLCLLPQASYSCGIAVATEAKHNFLPRIYAVEQPVDSSQRLHCHLQWAQFFAQQSLDCSIGWQDWLTRLVTQVVERLLIAIQLLVGENLSWVRHEVNEPRGCGCQKTQYIVHQSGNCHAHMVNMSIHFLQNALEMLFLWKQYETMWSLCSTIHVVDLPPCLSLSKKHVWPKLSLAEKSISSQIDCVENLRWDPELLLVGVFEIVYESGYTADLGQMLRVQAFQRTIQIVSVAYHSRELKAENNLKQNQNNCSCQSSKNYIIWIFMLCILLYNYNI